MRLTGEFNGGRWKTNEENQIKKEFVIAAIFSISSSASRRRNKVYPVIANLLKNFLCNKMTRKVEKDKPNEKYAYVSLVSTYEKSIKPKTLTDLLCMHKHNRFFG